MEAGRRSISQESEAVENSFESRVEATAYQGNVTDVFVRNPGQDHKEFRIQAPRDASCRTGETLRYFHRSRQL